LRVVERETDEEGGEDTQRELGVDVGGRAPVLLEDADSDDLELFAEGGSEFAEAGLVLALLG
jgi:hypothetical protein